MLDQPSWSGKVDRHASAQSSGSRTFLQDRVRLLSKVLFILTVSFLFLPFLLVWLFGSLDEAVGGVTLRRLMHVALAATVGVIWMATHRLRMSARTLHVVDSAMLGVFVIGTLALVLTFSTGMVGGLIIAASLGHLLVLRAVVVPSSGRRTLWLGSVAGVWAIAALWGLSVMAPTRSSIESAIDPAQGVINLTIWLLFSLASSTIASRVIFGLRREVKEARTIGQYVLRRRLGKGGMGTVYQATHAMLRRETAIKLISPTKVQHTSLCRFEREVCQTARLTHPNTIAIFDYGRTPEGVFYYAMEYVDGIDLQRLVDTHGPLPPARVIHILSQVLSSLEEAHGLGLIHRDIKPANIMLTQRGGRTDVVKVLDFGLVKEVQPDHAVSLTASDAVTGTPMFLPPEAIEAEEKVGPVSDLYAVAAVGYFLLTGTPVFRGRTAIEVCAHHLLSEPEAPASRRGEPLPEDLSALVLQGLAKDPASRPDGARAFRRALLACDVPRWSDEAARSWWRERGNKDTTPRLRASENQPAQTGRDFSAVS